MKRFIFIVGVVSLLVLAAALSASASQPGSQSAMPALMGGGTPTAVPTCAPSWAIVASATLSDTVQGSSLASIDSVSSTDIWSVGYFTTLNPSHRKRLPETKQMPSLDNKGQKAPSLSSINAINTLIEHWDGVQWTQVPSPNIGTDDNSLLMVDAVSTNDVWAAGYYVNDFGISQTLVQHWDGATWSVQTTPNTGGLLENRLVAIEAVSPTDVWAVGSYYDEDAISRTLTIHYDGTAWTIVASPNNGDATQNNQLNDLAVVSSGDIWAAGYYENANHIPRSLLLRWNGTQWNLAPTPGIGSGENALLSIDASSATDVWAVGVYATSNYGYRALTQHWDGTQWTVIATPSQSGDSTILILYSVETVSSTDAWAVGNVSTTSSYPKFYTLHWDGTAWTVVRAVMPQDSFVYYLNSVDVIGTNDVWTVGSSNDYYARQPIIEHFSTACLTCPARFVDVPVGSTFYDSVQCLACQELVGGYPPTQPPFPSPIPTSSLPTATGVPPTSQMPMISATPTATIPIEFRPNANITRGQLAKIVSNSAGYDDDPGPQLFEDVYPYYYDSQFYVWINRLAKRGIVGGYPCGGDGEPCGYDNLPYYRANSEATRAQISKIVSTAAGYTEAHTDQMFADVPLTHQFYQWIARLASRGLISGYPCGGPGEPCDSQNRPYFRPDTNATRGQVTKIVAKGFFPNCYVP